MERSHESEEMKTWPPQLRTDIPAPKPRRRGSWRRWKWLQEAPIGASWVFEDAGEFKCVYGAASFLHVRIVSQKLNGCGYRVWRIG